MQSKKTYYDADPLYLREQTPQWYQQLQSSNEMVQSLLGDLISPETDVLQIGCGGGWLGGFLLARKIRSYMGFDYSACAVEQARQRLKNYSNASVYVADALVATSYPKRVDLVLAHQFAQCMIGDDRKTWLEHARNCLNPQEGILLLSCMVDIPSGLRTVVDEKTRINPYHNCYYADRATVLAELACTGFSVVNSWDPEENMLIVLARSSDS